MEINHHLPKMTKKGMYQRDFLVCVQDGSLGHVVFLLVFLSSSFIFWIEQGEKMSKSGKKSVVSDAHVAEAAKLEAALNVSMNVAKSIVAKWISPAAGDDDAGDQKPKDKGPFILFHLECLGVFSWLMDGPFFLQLISCGAACYSEEAGETGSGCEVLVAQPGADPGETCGGGEVEEEGLGKCRRREEEETRRGRRAGGG